MSPKQPPLVNAPRPPDDLGNPTEHLIECSNKLLEGWFELHNTEKLSVQQRRVLTKYLYATMNAVVDLIRATDLYPAGGTRLLEFTVSLERFREEFLHRHVPR